MRKIDVVFRMIIRDNLIFDMAISIIGSLLWFSYIIGFSRLM